MKRVLLIEDDDAFAYFLSTLLPGTLRYTASTFERAIEYLSSTRFDVVICDLVLPGVSPARVQVEVGMRCGNAVFIILTGAVSSVPRGCDAWANKIDIRNHDDLLELIRKGWQRKHGVRGYESTVDTIENFALLRQQPAS